MTPPVRVLLVAGGMAIALAVLLWPRHAPPSPAAEHATPPAREEVVARDASVVVAAASPHDAGAQPAAPVRVESASETELLDAAEARLAREPEQTLALIEAADGRFGAQNEARRALEIEALVKLERIGLSHAKAEQFYRAFPKSPAAKRIERLTGYHPRPWGPREDDE